MTGSITIEFEHNDPSKAWKFVDSLERHAEEVPVEGRAAIKITSVHKDIER